jgi:hypothetical protein
MLSEPDLLCHVASRPHRGRSFDWCQPIEAIRYSRASAQEDAPPNALGFVRWRRLEVMNTSGTSRHALYDCESLLDNIGVVNAVLLVEILQSHAKLLAKRQ